MLSIFSTLAIILCLQNSSAVVTYFQLDKNWTLVRSDDVNMRFTNLTLPTFVHQVLLSQDVISDPYYGYNDWNYRWIPESNWTFSLSFNSPDDWQDLGNDSVFYLVFDGLDTVGIITFNGEFLGSTDNMFRSWLFPFSLKPSGNLLEVLIVSPVDYAWKQSREYPYTVPPVCPVESYRGFCQFNFIRKDASSFSWDWGPGFAPQGFWKLVYVVAMTPQDLPIKSISPNVNNSTNGWVVNITALPFNTSFPRSFVKSCSSGNFQMAIEIPELSFSSISTNINWGPNSTAIHAAFLLPQTMSINLWWPNGFGKPKVYNMTIEIACPMYNALTITKTIGFRDIKLVQNTVYAQNGTQSGNSFYFEVNQIPMFAKGTNWIPADAFQTRISNEYLEYLLNSVKIANMNILRVWGGGVYETDDFYDLADRMGIMVWQDMMFACSLYPSNEQFLSNVKEEVVQQVYRLRSHPSIIIWAGNNENEAALSQNWWSVPDSTIPLYKSDYVKLYVDTVQAAVKRVDIYRPFITSSPSNGIESVSENYVSFDPYSNFYGDTHFYDYATDCFELSHYPVTRFASEYGFQSWPFMSTIEPVTSMNQRELNGTWFNERNHHPDGNSQILANLKRHFGYELPNQQLNERYNVDAFDWFAYLSQLENALCLRVETEHYMRHQGLIDATGRGNTMGAMYWQLNDIWQAPSWASIDYYGKWKMTHNFVRNIFEALHVFGQYDTTDNEVNIFVSSNQLEVIRDTSVQIMVLSLTQQTAVRTLKLNQDVLANTVTWIGQFSVAQLVTNSSCNSTDTGFCFAHVELVVNSQTISTNEVYWQNFDNTNFFPCAIVERVTYEVQNGTAGTDVTIQLKVSKWALFFWIDHSPDFKGHWTVNGEHLMTTEDNINNFREFVFYQYANDNDVQKFVSSLKFFYLNKYPNCA